MKIKEAAAWKKPTKNGGEYLSVKITFEDGSQTWVNLFNQIKKSEKQPDMKTLKEKAPIERVIEPSFPGTPDDESIPF